MSDSEYFELGVAIRELVWRIRIEGTPVGSYEAGHGGFTTYGPPWCVVDTAYAEPDVNWPGRLVGSADDPSKASEMQAVEIGRLAGEELRLRPRSAISTIVTKGRST